MQIPEIYNRGKFRRGKGSKPVFLPTARFRISLTKYLNQLTQLYPKLDELEEQKITERSVIKTKRENDKLLDSYTSQRKMENKMIMNNAQRELNQRIRNKMIEKSKRGNRNSFNSESYLEFYKRIKS